MEMKSKSGKEQAQKIEFTEEQIEIFARRILPALRRYFAKEDVKQEFEEWKKQQKTKIE